MTMQNIDKKIVDKVSRTLVQAGSTFLSDKKDAYMRAIHKEKNEQAKWTLETILNNALIAEKIKAHFAMIQEFRILFWKLDQMR